MKIIDQNHPDSLRSRIKELESQLVALQWQPITESNLPKWLDDEVLFMGRNGAILTVEVASQFFRIDPLSRQYRRPINAPAQEPK